MATKRLLQHPFVQSLQVTIRVGSVIYCCYEYGVNVTMVSVVSVVLCLSSNEHYEIVFGSIHVANVEFCWRYLISGPFNTSFYSL